MKTITTRINILRGVCILLLCTMLAVSCFGCKKASQQLSVYYLETGTQRQSMSRMSDYMVYFDKVMAEYKKFHPNEEVKLERFEDPDEMATRIAAEMAAGKGPDVILFNSESTVDYEKMALNGSFEDLSSYFDKDPTYDAFQYQQTVLESGKINGGQYLIPLGYRINYLYSAEKLLAERGYNPDLLTFTELVNLIREDKERNIEGEGTFDNSNMQYGSDLYFLMMSSGMDIVDMETRQVLLEKDTLRPIAETAKALNNELETLKGIAKNHPFSYFLDHVAFHTNDENIFFETWKQGGVMTATMNEDVCVTIIPSLTTKDEVSAVVTVFGAVNAASANKDKAFEFVRTAMDTEPTDYSYELSVKNAYVDALLTKVTTTTSENTFMSDGQQFALPPVNADAAQTLQWAVNSVKQADRFNPTIAGIIAETMDEYMTDTMSYDDAYDQLVNRLNLYINE